MDVRNHLCSQYKIKLKLTSGLTRYLNACTSLPLHIQHNRNIPILAEDNNILYYFIYHKEKKYLLGNKKQDGEDD